MEIIAWKTPPTSPRSYFIADWFHDPLLLLLLPPLSLSLRWKKESSYLKLSHLLRGSDDCASSSFIPTGNDEEKSREQFQCFIADKQEHENNG